MSSHLRSWSLLLLISAATSSVLLWFHLPAALLIGPMAAGILFSLRGGSLAVPRPYFLAAQAIIGCMIAQTLTPSILSVLISNWAVVLSVLLATLGASAATGWVLVRYSALPGVTGAWGTSPGGASAMVAMAQEFGADVRLVAFMQYLRVLFVSGAAVLVVRYSLGDDARAMTQPQVWFPPLHPDFFWTLLLTALAAIVGRISRFPSGVMLFPMLIGAACQTGGLLHIVMPEWLLALAYMVLGWSVGLNFNKAIFLLALKTLPQILGAILVMILFCALIAWGLTVFLGLDYLTAYLATSPGGLDAVAIIAAGSSADMSFVMAMQTLRLFSILLTGPAMARFISRHAGKREVIKDAP